MWWAAWALSGIRARGGEWRATATLIFFQKNVWASLEKCPTCIETWRQMESNSKVEVTVLFCWSTKQRWVVEFRSILCGRLRCYKNDSAAINKSCIIKIWQNKKEQRGFFFLSFFVVNLLQQAENGFLCCFESQSVSSRSAVLHSRCVHRVFFFFKLWFMSHISTKACVSCRHVIPISPQVSSPLKGLWVGQTEWDKDTFWKMFRGSLVHGEHGKQG